MNENGADEQLPKGSCNSLTVDLFCEIVAYLFNFPVLGRVCKRWAKVLDSDVIYFKVCMKLAGSRGITLRQETGWKAFWQLNFYHLAWRPTGGNLMVDFVTSVIENLTNDEGTLSQIYYTYPRVGLQFRQKFALFEIRSCNSLERIALKKGTHLRADPCTEKARYLATGHAEETIIKLDFTTTKEDPVTTSVVVWTTASIELFTYDKTTDVSLTTSETKMKYALRPLRPCRTLSLITPSSSILVVHINENQVISTLVAPEPQAAFGVINCYSFKTGSLLYSSKVPGPIRETGTQPGVSEKGEWKSRERFEFKGSSQIGALLDDNGVVQIFHHETKTWCSVTSKYWEKWKGSKVGPRPRFIRTAGCHVVVWNTSSQAPPYYIELWQCTVSNDVLQTKKIICECYHSISSVHLDDFRCYVNVVPENKDVLIDVWDLSTGGFICRVHAVNNSWSLEKDQVRTHLSKLFWSSPNCVIYYELNTKPDNTNALNFRQLSCVPQEEYWEICRNLKGDNHLKKETHRVLSTVRPHQL